MLISEDKKIIFVHIQKTAGESITELLKSKVPDIKPLLSKHAFALKGKNYLGDEKWSQYFKFSVVRNPWDRMVSWYSMISNNEPVNKLFEYVQENSNNFDEFIIKCTNTIYEEDGDVKSFLYNQIDYLTDEKGKLLVDKIIRFENLQDELKELFTKLDIDVNELPHIRHNSKRTTYRDYYTLGTQEIVKNRFERDISYFGYQY